MDLKDRDVDASAHKPQMQNEDAHTDTRANAIPGGVGVGISIEPDGDPLDVLVEDEDRLSMSMSMGSDERSLQAQPQLRAGVGNPDQTQSQNQSQSQSYYNYNYHDDNEEEDEEVEVYEPNPMDEIVPNLWIGNLLSALDEKTLVEKGIESVMSVMRGRLRVGDTFTHRQITLDDTSDADALKLFPGCIQWIEEELAKGRGVLVHCQAGMSRSCTIVAAYLMYSQDIDSEQALEQIMSKRPYCSPNTSFLGQLDVFYRAKFKVSKKNKATRMFYLERAVEDIMNGDGTLSPSATEMFPKFPRSPADSLPGTPGGPNSYMNRYGGHRRRIRCRMCRQELATREHMIDHGQVGPNTPASMSSLSPAVSRRPSASIHYEARSRPGSRRPSESVPVTSSGLGGLGMTPMKPVTEGVTSSGDAQTSGEESLNGGMAGTGVGASSLARRPSAGSAFIAPFSSLSMRRKSSGAGGGDPGTRPMRPSLLGLAMTSSEGADAAGKNANTSALDSGEDDEDEDEQEGEESSPTSNANGNKISSSPATTTVKRRTSSSASFQHHPHARPPLSPTQIQELKSHFSTHPVLAALRNPTPVPSLVRRNSGGGGGGGGLGGIGGLQPMTRMSSTAGDAGAGADVGEKAAGGSGGASGSVKQLEMISPPLLVNPKCSGYFLEPEQMKWMLPSLPTGQLAGKILCPNKKCNAKLGNYDWAGVCCACREWVVPGFCIHRSKVDEFVV